MLCQQTASLKVRAHRCKVLLNVALLYEFLDFTLCIRVERVCCQQLFLPPKSLLLSQLELMQLA